MWNASTWLYLTKTKNVSKHPLLQRKLLLARTYSSIQYLYTLLVTRKLIFLRFLEETIQYVFCVFVENEDFSFFVSYDVTDPGCSGNL